MFLTGFLYPILFMIHSVFPCSKIGRFSHHPRVAFNCQAASEIYYLILIITYPSLVDSKASYLGYNIILTIITLAKIHREQRCLCTVRAFEIFEKKRKIFPS